MTNIAFLGAGRMAGAMVRGVIARGISPESIRVRAGSGTSAATLAAATGISPARDNAELLDGAEVFVLACKPQHFSGLPAELADLTEGKLVVSVLAGVTTVRLAGAFPKARAIVRAMPNTPGAIGAGITPYSPALPLTLADAALTESVLGALGKTMPLPESEMDAATAAAGCAPGFFFELVAQMEAAAIRLDLPPETAALLVREAFIGSAKLLEKSGAAPGALRDAVTSPGGATFAGLTTMREHGIEETLAATLAAATRRSHELSTI